jgi:hypothetical protein
MCLDNVDPSISPCDVGYKAFCDYGDGGLRGDWMNIDVSRPVGKWLDEKYFRPEYSTITIISKNQEPYPIGWHVFHTYEDAVSWATNSYCCIRKVKVKNPVATGIQFVRNVGEKHPAPVTICKHIFIETVEYE